MAGEGYVRIHRSLLGHPAFRNDAEAMAFAWLVAKASWQGARVRYKEHTISLKRGDLSVSIRDMAEALDRPKGWVERLIFRLKNETMIETRRATGGRTAPLVVTICKYDTYQGDNGGGRTRGETRGGTQSGTAAGQRPDREQGREEDKKKEDTIVSSSARGHRLPADWQPGEIAGDAGETWRRWSVARRRATISNFRDYWATKAGSTATKLDWDAAFRMWVRKDARDDLAETRSDDRAMLPLC